jgi:hypothetical protein
VRLRLEQRFKKSRSSLPNLQRRIDETLGKLLRSPDLRGLNLEKIKRPGDYYTIRVNRNFRILLRRETDEKGELFAVLDVAPHDATYRY